jgi:hypothetical protein
VIVVASHRYAGRQIALPTRHGKQRVLARPLWHGLGLELRHAATVDTDTFGSFSGEISRPADALNTCRLKAEAGMRALALDLGIASEGAFGPHPAVPLLPVGREWMVFVDQRDHLVISEQLLCRTTNFSSCRASDPAAITGWLKQVGFPSHALMVRVHEPSAPTAPWLAKGVQDPIELADLMAAAAHRSPLGQAWLETDMRAHCNPTRRASIRQLAFQLVRRVASACPACGAPGWGVVSRVPGLPCSSCGLGTELIHFEQLGCVACDHTQLHPRRDGLISADPSQCPYCNP